MTYIAKLTRRLACAYAALLFAFALSLGGCDAADRFAPLAGEDAPTPTGPTAATGIPFGTFGLPRTEYANTAAWTASLKHLSPDSSALAELAVARQHGVRMVISLAGDRSTFKNSDGTFSLAKWKANVDRWRTIDLTPYIADGTIIGHYLVDEPDWVEGWGGHGIGLATLEEMARYSKARWPTMATTVRVVPRYLVGYPWHALDFAWAQWTGPLHSPSSHMTPEEFRDQQVADAKAAGLQLMFGMNLLDGGDGSSGIAGTYDLHHVRNRWQMSATEVEHVGTVLAAAPYACGVINWRWSPDYPAYGSLSAKQLAGIRKFNHRSDVQTALTRVAGIARQHSTTSCKRRG